MFIHRHTLSYRLKQIETRTGCSLKSTDDRMKLQLSIMAYRLSGLLDQMRTIS
ncbi:helix-turn-helix domain-containing protein [Bacillus pumilus]|nr:helix-turn-helix domain-containing protein [Bacillus safensis]WOP21402.1 helix-turn-helix domain-containing protein [Bacillus pumilus]